MIAFIEVAINTINLLACVVVARLYIQRGR